MKTFALVLAILLASAGAASAGARGAHSERGWELYSWRAEGRWYFSLVAGGERTLEEIAAAKLEGLAPLERRLGLLEVGERITFGGGAPGRASRIFRAPPAPVAERIRARCARLKLDVAGR